jgi:hypothetical protein
LRSKPWLISDPHSYPIITGFFLLLYILSAGINGQYWAVWIDVSFPIGSSSQKDLEADVFRVSTISYTPAAYMVTSLQQV